MTNRMKIKTHHVTANRRALRLLGV